jgi:hypothetical protein
VLAELLRLGLLSDDRRDYPWYAKDRADDCHDRARGTEIARRIWNAAKDPRGTPVERCLRSRGITSAAALSALDGLLQARPDGNVICRRRSGRSSTSMTSSPMRSPSEADATA